MIAAAIRDVPLFDRLDDRQLDAVASVLQARRVPPGTTIFSEGQRSTSVFILTSGSVGTSKRMGLSARASDEPTKQKVLVHLRAPQFFGEMGLLSDVERSATITSDTECELLELTRADFEHLAVTDPALGFQLVRNIAIALAERLRRTDLDVVKLTTALSLALGNR